MANIEVTAATRAIFTLEVRFRRVWTALAKEQNYPPAGSPQYYTVLRKWRNCGRPRGISDFITGGASVPPRSEESNHS